MDLNTLTLDILEKLIEKDTINPPGNELRGAQYLKELFDGEGLPCEIQDLGNNRANFIAEIGEGKPVLEFSGHLDVVPCIGDWQHKPLAATKESDRIYGRGTCDMKGGIAAMCAAAIALKRGNFPLHGKLRLVFVADEEHANLGMHAFLNRYEAAEYTILGEPTDLHVAVAHRGVARYYVDLLGHACHAALRMEEESAVEKAARAVWAIRELNRRLMERKHPVLPPPSIVVTQIEGYEKDNVVPGRVRLLTDFRVLPGMTQQEAKEIIEEALNQAGIESYVLEKRFYMPGGEVDPRLAFVQRCCDISGDKNDREEVPCAFDASCEQCFLVEAGSQAVILGPGSLNQAHTVDEYVEEEQLLRAVQIYQSIALSILGD